MAYGSILFFIFRWLLATLALAAFAAVVVYVFMFLVYTAICKKTGGMK